MSVRFLLANRFPLLLWWGADYISIYNDAYAPILGRKHPDALGKPVAEVWSEIWHILQPLIDTPFKGGPSTWIEDFELYIARSGFTEEGHFTVAYSPVPDDDAPTGIGGVLATVHEITEKVIAERRTIILRDLGSRVGDAKSAEEACAIAAETLARHPRDIPFAALYLVEADGKTARLAGSAGVAPGEAAAPPVIALDADAAHAWPLQRAMKSEGMEIVGDLAHRFACVPKGPYDDPPNTAAVLPIPSNKTHEFAGFLVVGVSARLKLDYAYQSFLQLVATQIAATVANARAYEEERKRAEGLAEIDRAKTTFFSNISHEFRTPLALILGPLEELLAADSVAATERSQLTLAHRNGLRLLRLVNTLLDFTRVEAGRTQASFEPSDLAHETAELASTFRSACERAGISLVVDVKPMDQPVFLDREMWEKIVLNLISNAFKFTLEGEIEIRVRGVPQGAVLTVRDTGVGIPAAELPRIFDRFHRVENAGGRTHEGSGIGLALVEELVKLHGGAIEASSILGRGSTFTVRLPFGSDHLPKDRINAERGQVSTATRAEAFVQEALRWLPGAGQEAIEVSDVSASPPQSSGRRARVLFADDNADMRDYVARLLAPRYDVETVEDGEAAIAAARRLTPDLILSDVMMPRLDGLGLLAAARADPVLREIPVILLSARAGEEAKVHGLEAGATDYLVKPFAARELIARVQANLDLAQARSEARRAIEESETRSRLALQSAAAGTWDWDLRSNRIFWSPENYALYDIDSTADGVTHLDWQARLHPDDRLSTAEAVRNGLESDAADFRAEFRIVRRDGRIRWLLGYARVERGDSGEPVRVTGINLDITPQIEREEQIRLLLAEVNHRAKNILALVQAVARQTIKTDPGEFLTRFEQRIHALAAAQDLLIGSQWKGVTLTDLVRSQLAHFKDLIGSRIVMRGPPLQVSVSAAQTLGMTLHELATNAGKYGALSNETGRVEVTWNVAGGAFLMTWVERGGPPVTPPTRRGFGSTVIDTMAKSTLRATVTLEYPPEGFTWRLECEGSRALESYSADHAAQPTPTPLDRSRAGRMGRILVVEDEALVGLEVATVLEDAGYEVIGPAGSVRQALDILDRHGCDYAVLDVNLGAETSEPIADRLRKLAVPFIVVSGYSREQQPALFKGARFLAKPLNPEVLVAELRRLVQQHSQRA